MRIGRAIIIPAILALGVAGSTVAGSAIVAVGSQLHPHASSTQAQSNGPASNPNIYFHA